jgi:hypothetical protein
VNSLYASAEWRAFTTCPQVAAAGGCTSNVLEGGYLPQGSDYCPCSCDGCGSPPGSTYTRCGGDVEEGGSPTPAETSAPTAADTDSPTQAPTQAPTAAKEEEATTASPTKAPTAGDVIDDVEHADGSGARLKTTAGAIGVSALAGVVMGL